MFARFSRGRELAKLSARVLNQDRELLVFPLLSGSACLLVLASFALPLWQTGRIQQLMENAENFPTDDPLLWATMFLFYFANYFVVVFFNSALVACAIIRLTGGNPTVTDGFRASMSRLPLIAGWALVGATVGVVLKSIESRSERFGQVIVALLGLSWTLVTFFVIPVLVVERKSPIDAIRRSMSILRRTWGEAIGADFGIGFLMILPLLAAIAPLVGGIFALSNQMQTLGIFLIVLSVGAIITVRIIASALETILLATLYVHATKGSLPAFVDENNLEAAFRVR